MIKPIAVIDLYCGMGGFTEGAVQAGATVILSADFWDEAVLVHKQNHPGIPCLKLKLGSLTDWKLIKQYIDRYPNHHIHLHGSPPCQALSNASRTDASEGMPLIYHFLDLVDKLNPDSWSMENVVPVRKRLPEDIPSVILNSADFGVPQTRRRCIAGKGWEAKPSHNKDQWVSVIQALPHIEKELEMDSGRANATTTGINPKTGKKEGGSGYLTRSLDQPSYTIMTSPRKLVVNTVGGGSSNGRRVNSVDTEISKPSKTINNNRPSLRYVTHNVAGATESIGEAAESRDRVITKPSKVIYSHHTTIRDRTDWNKPKKIRSLDLSETLVLQGFSPDYDLSSTKTKKSRWTMVGNAVCPPVARAIIEGIRNG